ncbi:MAG: hypothetical protein RJA81_1671 [Planctomycetota bacterium]|jgi:uncharacterized protein YcfL
MKISKFTAAIVSSIILAGCGSDSDVVTDPNQLKPLTEAEKAEIKKQDELVEQEEGESQKMIMPKEKSKK